MRKFIWLVASGLMALALLAAACAPAEEAAPTGKTPAEKTPAAKEEVTPEEKEITPAPGADTITIKATKVDGTVVEKTIERPRYGGTLSFSYSSPLTAWDEAIQAPWTTMAYLSYTNEELIQGIWERGPAVTGEVEWASTGWWANPDFMKGALAESWDIVDDETIVFHIRKGVKWHNKPPMNGREFNANDVVFNLKRIYFNIKTATMYSIAGDSRPTDVYAEDDWTVVVKAPKGQIGYTWEYLADWTRMFPPEVIEKYGDHNQWENVSGTGPFILTDYVPMSQVTWVKNPDYWMENPLIPGDRLPYFDNLKMLIVPDRSTELAALRTGKLEVHYGAFGKDDAEPLLKTSPQLISNHYLSPGYSLYGMRLDKPDLPWAPLKGDANALKVRRALHMAINNQEIVDTYWGGEGAVLNYKIMPLKELMGMYTPLEELPPSADGFDNRKLYSGYYPEEAKQMLAEAGYPNGFETSVVVQSTNEVGLDQLTIVQSYWAKIGVKLNLDIKETGTFYSIYQKKTHAEGLYCGRWGDQPFGFFTNRAGNMYNWAMWSDPVTDDYYNQATAAFFDVAKREAIMKEANLYIIDQVGYYVPPVGNSYYVWQPWLKNYYGERSFGVASAYPYKYAWIDEDLKKSMGY